MLSYRQAANQQIEKIKARTLRAGARGELETDGMNRIVRIADTLQRAVEQYAIDVQMEEDEEDVDAETALRV